MMLVSLVEEKKNFCLMCEGIDRKVQGDKILQSPNSSRIVPDRFIAMTTGKVVLFVSS